MDMSDWTFDDAQLAADFDSYVREQLPWYETATAAMVSVVRQYLPHGGLIYDIGCSTGNVARALTALLKDRGANLVGIEQSPTMAKRYNAIGEIVIDDLRTHEPEPFDVAVSFLTWMFLHPSQQEAQLQRWMRKAKRGAAMVLVERTTSPAGYPSLVLARMTLEAKRNAGANAQSVLDKEVSLAGVQRPVCHELLQSFRAVEFFRFADFGGYIVEAAK